MAANKNPFANQFQDVFAMNPFMDFSKYAGKFSAPQSFPSVDFGKLVTLQRKQLEAFNEAAQLASETAQGVARQQLDTARASFEQALGATRELMTSKNPETNAARQAELAKEMYEDALANLREASETASKASFEAYDKIQSHMMESFEEFKAATGFNG